MEERSGLRRIYRKSWPYDNLFGTLRFELSSGNRGIWNDFLDFAKISRVKPGVIAAGTNTPYSHAWLSQFLNVPLELLDETIKVLIRTDRIKENSHGIEILNWGKYQTDYDRQKPYRDRKREAPIVDGQMLVYFQREALTAFKKKHDRKPTVSEESKLLEKVGADFDKKLKEQEGDN